MSPLQVQGQHRAPQGSAATLATVPRCCTSPCSRFVPSVLRALKPHVVAGVHVAGWSGVWFPWLLSPHRWCLSLPGGSQPAWKEAFSRTSACTCQKISVLIRSCADWLAVQVLSEIHIYCVEHKAHSHIWRQTEAQLQISDRVYSTPGYAEVLQSILCSVCWGTSTGSAPVHGKCASV